MRMNRKVADGLFFVILLLCSFLSVVTLGSIFWFIFSRGAGAFYTQLFQLSSHDLFATAKLQAMFVSTILLVLVTLLIIGPFAILAAIYLSEYAKRSRLAGTIRFLVDVLASIPSIIYGLFGMALFTQLFQFGMSIISGAMTLSLMLLPILMRQTELALSQVPISYKEASFGLGATRFETIWKVVIPNALPSIGVGFLLVIGRIVGESAALLFTVGSFVRMPINRGSGLLSIFEAGTTLTIRAFIEVKEYGNVEVAAAIGILILLTVVTLNGLAKLVIWMAGGVVG